MRRAVDRQHRHVRSRPGDPVAYDAFDPELQLWVSACLYTGLEDVHRILFGPLDDAERDVMYRHAARLGTTLQVSEDRWPADREAFQRYWDDGVRRIEMDDVTRRYLQGIARADFVAAPLRWSIGPVNELLTMGFLAPRFRDELGLPWSPARQRAFDSLVGTAAAVHRRLPGPVRAFPFDLCLWDTRRRIRSGRSIV